MAAQKLLQENTKPAPLPPRLKKARWGGEWGEFLTRRLGRLAISIFVLVSVSFLMIRMIPGDPVRNALGIMASHEVVEARREALGLNLPLWEQYLRFWQGLFTGNLGDSFTLQMPVTTVIGQRLPATLEIAFMALVVLLAIAIPVGIVAAALTRGGRRRGLELGYTTVSGLIAVIPEFLLGVGLIYIFAVQFQLLPVAGRSGPESYILPVLALSIGGIAGVSRIVRAEALTVLSQDYIRTARAKRMKNWRIYLRHVIPNLLTSSLTIGGLALGSLIAGTVLVETIFSWPGLGMTIVSSIKDKDFPLAQGVIIVYGLMVLLVTLVVDILLVLVDPRSALKEN